MKVSPTLIILTSAFACLFGTGCKPVRTAMDERNESSAKEIYFACVTYAHDKDGQFPNHLQSLLKNNVLFIPNRSGGLENSKYSHFHIIRDQNENTNPPVIFLYTSVANGKQTVCYTDGRVETITEGFAKNY